jgi:ubiquinone/menaquinone biosynthesis C-methylase UbiE
MREDGYSAMEGKTSYNHEQKLVDELFDAKSTFWRDIYQQNDVQGLNFRKRQAIALKYVDGLSLPKSVRVLEIGCGAGFMAIALARRGFKVEAVDHAPAMIELTQRHARQTGMDNQIHAAIEDVHGLTFEDQSFDLIVALGVISWLHDLRRALAEITRVLKNRRYVVLSSLKAHPLLNPLSIPAFESVLETIKRQLEKSVLYNPRNAARPRHHSNREFDRYLHEAKLAIIDETNVGFGPFTILNHKIFSDEVQVRFQKKLHQYADSGCPILRSAGAEHIVLARKK